MKDSGQCSEKAISGLSSHAQHLVEMGYIYKITATRS